LLSLMFFRVKFAAVEFKRKSNMQIGIVGFPLSGKSTLFNTLLRNRVGESEYKSKQQTVRGVISVQDERLDRLTALFNPRRKVPAAVEYVLVPGLDSRSEKGFSPDFFSRLKSVDEILLVVRAFENEFYSPPEEKADSRRDIGFAMSEFILSDMMIIERRIERLEKQLKKLRNADDEAELRLLKKCLTVLESEKPLRVMDLNDDERKRLQGYQFLSMKPILIVLNIDEDRLSDTENIEHDFRNYADDNVTVMALCLKIESEIAELDDDDQRMFLDELGIREPAVYRLVRKSYDLLGLISFFTVGEDECRAWTIRSGLSAQQAAGVIHSDLERGFIRADVVHWDDLLRKGSLAACRSEGLLRLEGKDYIVRDGDVMEIRFNV